MQQETQQASGTRYMLQEIASHLDTPDIQDTEGVAARFDVSPFRLWLLFRSVDSNGDGCVSGEELVSCLASTDEMHASVLSAPPFRQLWDMLTEGEAEAGSHGGRHLSFPQFCRLMRYLWLQQLLNGDLDDRGHHGDYAFDCVDYSGSHYELKRVPGHINAESRRFFTVPQHPRAKMRWIDVPSVSSGAYRITILRLGVKYRFHPTSVEDAIDLELQAPKVNAFGNSLLDLGDFRMDSIMWLRHGVTSHEGCRDSNRTDNSETVVNMALPLPKPTRTRSMFENNSFGSDYGSNLSVYEEGDVIKGHGRHYFITIPMFELTKRSQRSLDNFGNPKDDLEPKHLKSVLDNRTSSLHLKSLAIEVREATLGIFVASAPESNLVVTVSTKWKPTRVKPTCYDDSNYDSTQSLRDDDEEDSRDAKISLDRVKRLLQKRHSKQRHGDSNWLMHAVIDAVVDNLRPISRIYEAQLQQLTTRLLELGHQLTKHEVKDMIVMKRDLEWLQHQLRPLQRVLRHLIDDKNIGVEVTHYLEDVEDHLQRLMDELAAYARECESLKDEYNSYLDRRMNDVLYVLTLVTTLVVPAQFLTGYYGMNFINNDTGEMGEPLLNLGGIGVILFWVITVGTTGVVTFVMYHYKWFDRSKEG